MIALDLFGAEVVVAEPRPMRLPARPTPRMGAVLRGLAHGARLVPIDGTQGRDWELLPTRLHVTARLLDRMQRAGWLSLRRAVDDGAAAVTDAGVLAVAPRSRWSPRIGRRQLRALAREASARSGKEVARA